MNIYLLLIYIWLFSCVFLHSSTNIFSRFFFPYPGELGIQQNFDQNAGISSSNLWHREGDERKIRFEYGRSFPDYDGISQIKRFFLLFKILINTKIRNSFISSYILKLSSDWLTLSEKRECGCKIKAKLIVWFEILFHYALH